MARQSEKFELKEKITLPDSQKHNVWSFPVVPKRYQSYKLSFQAKIFNQDATLGANIYKSPEDDSPHSFLHLVKSIRWKEYFTWIFHNSPDNNTEKFVRLFKINGNKIMIKGVKLEKAPAIKPILHHPTSVADYLIFNRLQKDHLSFQSFPVQFKPFKTYQIRFKAKCSIIYGWLAVGIKSNPSQQHFKHIPFIKDKKWNEYSATLYSENIIEKNKAFLHFETSGTNKYFTSEPFEAHIKDVIIQQIKPENIRILSSSPRARKAISIVIPYFNDHAIEKVFLGINNQEYHRDLFEVICVDDSRNETKEKKLRRLISKQSFHIKYLKKQPTKKWPSICSARNSGITLAKGEILALLDNDIFLPPWYLSRQAKIHKRYPNTAVQSIRYFVHGKTQKCSYQELCKIAKEGDRDLNRQISFYNRIFPEKLLLLPAEEEFLLSTYAVSLPLSAILNAGCFNSKLFDGGYSHEDTELGYRLFKKGMRGILDLKSRVIHFNHPRPNQTPDCNGMSLYERNLRLLIRQGYKRKFNIYLDNDA